VTDTGPNRWFFDLWSRFYDLRLVQRLTYRPVHDAVLRALVERPGRRVLDIGCGTGLLAARIAETLPAARVVGCDFSNGMLRHAAAHDGAARRIRWVQGDAVRLPFRDATFDTVVSTEAFHWFPDQPAALAQFHRVLQPGGRLLVGLVNPPLELLSETARVVSRLAGEPFYWPTARRLRRWFEAAGFRVESQRRVFRLPMGVTFPPVLTVGMRS
jgi:ubiquinone/menaquinone biosynthesis C-methylase UbiE